MDAVNLSGTWSKKTRPNNGLTKVADLINDNRTTRVPIVGWVEFHQYTEVATGNTLTVALPVVEAVVDAEGNDTHGWGKSVIEMIDALRKERGLGTADDVPPQSGAQLEGQQSFDFDGPDDGEPRRVGEVRIGPDGEHTVPEASGEELLAEAEEARAAGVPAAEFSGGDQ
ncbi:hypothetical protein Aph02nite_17190 [Actinoplanes philippinensis]|uniref:Uncharacterized protein n=1 Tax=Actinoplanes philippinensis TaxID=35752 RepID=A0A1I2B9V3_9ACTN|nr:hypothetical protein [Actinoplanes philippinensis]GIE75769.1 hypothetical protein Aph02nite_17190 [Actinoplanes philippinensis]SFE52678.1 hypothetical protein SAMN05421541_102183 [Actinoplanes philippinensis]